MRIAFFSDNSYPELSGIVDSIHITGKELSKRGHEVVFVGPHYSDKNYATGNRKRAYEGGHEVVHGLPIFRIPSLPLPFSPTGQSRVALPVGASFWHLDKFKPDIIHTQSPYGTGLEALWAAHRYKAPLVGTNHTPIEEFYPWAPTMMRHFDAWYYNKCDFITAPYQGLIDNMRTFGLKTAGHGQANPVPFISASNTDAEKQQCKIDMKIHGPMVLVSGRLAPEKKVDVIIRSFKKVQHAFPTATLVITGHGSYSGALQSLAAELGIQKNVRFVGFITTDKIKDLYCTADVYAIMSTAETQSLSLMQAFAAGVPAVAASSRGLVDYCPPQCGFQIEPGDSETCADKIIELLSKQELRTRMGAAGTEFVKKFSPEKIAQDWEAIYAKVLAKN
jgi:1,2-diacylglycerol 3-alpha-glucosyltransferase